MASRCLLVYNKDGCLYFLGYWEITKDCIRRRLQELDQDPIERRRIFYLDLPHPTVDWDQYDRDKTMKTSVMLGQVLAARADCRPLCDGYDNTEFNDTHTVCDSS